MEKGRICIYKASVEKMRDDQKNKAELLQEMETLRKCVAKLRQIEEALRESEEKWRSLLNNTPDIVMIVDRDGAIRFINHTVRGIKEQEATGKRVYDYISPEHHDTMRKDLERVFQTGQSTSQEFSGVGPHGNLSWYQAELGPIRQDRRVVAASIVTRDITEHKRAEEALKKSEQRFRSLVEVTSDWVWEVDKNSIYTYASPKVKGLLGYEPQEVVGKTPFDLMPPGEAERVDGLFKDIIKSRKPFNGLENTNLHKDGRLVVLETSGVPIFDASGGLAGYRGIDRDITKRKQAEEEIKKFKEMTERATFGCAMADLNGNLTYVNDSFAKMHGYAPAELIAKNLKIFHADAQIKRVSQLNKRLMETEKGIRGEEVWHVRRDGTEFPTLMSSWILKDPDGKPFLLCATAIDVTERKKAEEALRESENKYRTLLENLPQKIFLKDRNSVYISCNENYAGDFKIKSEGIVGKTDYDFYPKELAEKYRADDKRIMESGGTEDIEEKHIRQGQEMVVHTVKTAVKDAQGNVIGILGVFRDITKHKKAEEELNEYREKMARAERLASVGTLSAIMAHTLNNPLTAIQLSIQNAMAESKKTRRQSTITKYLKDSLRSVSDVSSTVRSLGKIAAESSKEIISEVNLKAVAERIVKLLSESARRTKMSLHLEGIGELPPIYSNEKDLEQLFFSLVENAIQAADGKKSHQLIISGAVKDEKIELRFTDNCGGITSENLDKIFELFFTTKPAGERTGLGLCIVERIVSGAGGKIRVESKAGKGSTFFVTLPISRGRRY